MPGKTQEMALRPVRDDDLPMLEELTQDPEKLTPRRSSNWPAAGLPSISWAA
jgi:hypothetical protein